MSKSQRSARGAEQASQSSQQLDPRAAMGMANSFMMEVMASGVATETSGGLLDGLLAGSGSNAGLEPGPGATQTGPPPSSSSSGAPAPPAGGVAPLTVEPGLGAGPASGVTRAPDGMTDYYMETHWDSGPFYQQVDQFGLPGRVPDAVSHIDALLPADLSPDTRAVIHIACSIGTGALDSYLTDQILSSMGTPGAVLGQLVGIGKGIEDYVQLDDPLGAALFGGTVVLDAAIDAIGTFCEELNGDLGTLQTVCGYAAQLPAFIAGVLGPEATVAVQLLAADILAAIEVPRIIVAMGAAVADELRAALDVVLFVYNDARALQAQGHDQFEKAARYKDLMRDNVLDALTDHLNATINAIWCLPLAGIAKTHIGVLKMGMKGVDFVLEQTTGVGLPSIEDLAAATKAIGGELSDTEGFNNLLDPLGAGDAMRVAPDSLLGGHFTERDDEVGGEGEYTSVLQKARAQTLGQMDASYVSLRNDPPAWYQKLINQIAEDDETTFADATSPLYWITELMQAIPGLAELVADTSAEGLADACDTAAGYLGSDLQPIADVLTGAIAGYKPELDEILIEMNTMVQDQDLQLDRLHAMIGNVDVGLAELEGMLGQIDGLGASVNDAIGSLDAMRIDPGAIELPPMVPPELVATLIDPINEQIDALQEQLAAMVDQSLQGVRDTVQVGIDNLQEQLIVFEAALAEGGSFRQAVEAQVAEVKATIDGAVELFTEWDGVLTFDLAGASEFLRSVAEACRTYADHEQQIEDPWAIILTDIARPGVDDWRARHDDDVAAQYEPPVPEAELAACGQIYDAAREKAERAGDFRNLPVLQDAYDAVMSYEGQAGRSELYGFWSASSALLKVANRIG